MRPFVVGLILATVVLPRPLLAQRLTSLPSLAPPSFQTRFASAGQQTERVKVGDYHLEGMLFFGVIGTVIGLASEARSCPVYDTSPIAADVVGGRCGERRGNPITGTFDGNVLAGALIGGAVGYLIGRANPKWRTVTKPS